MSARMNGSCWSSSRSASRAIAKLGDLTKPPAPIPTRPTLWQRLLRLFNPNA